MNEILSDIFKHAGSSGQVNLLQVLKSYEKVIESRKILYYSDEGVEIYKTLLLWGRENNKRIGSKEAPSPNKLQVSDLLENKHQETIQTVQFNSLESFSPAKTAVFALPSFRTFEKQSKPPSPNQTLAEAFSYRQLKSRTWLAWKNLQKQIKQEREAELKRIEKNKKYSKIYQYSSTVLYKKSLKAWIRFNLIQVQKKIAVQMDFQITIKKHWQAWQLVQRKREILKGMKFTASFIHKQWLMKKVLLVLTRFVHNQMINKLKIGRLNERLNKNLLEKIVDNWKVFVNISLLGKVLRLKSQKLLIRNLKKRGLLMMAWGCQVSQEEEMKKSLALGCFAKNCYQKTIGAWFAYIVVKKKKMLRRHKACVYRNNALVRGCFEWFSFIVNDVLEKRENALREFQKTKARKVILGMRIWNDSNRAREYDGRVYFYLHLLLGEGDQYNFGSSNFQIKKLKRSKFAIEKLKTYIKQAFISTLKKEASTIKSFKIQKSTKKKSKIFQYWKKKSQKKLKNSSILSKLSQKKRRNLTQKIFRSWSKKYLKIRLNKLIYKQHSIESQEKIFKSYLQTWVKKLRTRLRHKKENSLVPIFSRQTLLNKYLDKWMHSYKKLKKKSHLSHISKRFFLTKFTSKAWVHWRKMFLEKIKLDYKSTKVADFYSNKLITKTFAKLKKISALCRCKRFKVYKADDQHEWVLKVKSIISWTNFISYYKSKKNLYEQLRSDRNKVISGKILKFLKIYSQYRIKNRTRDSLTFMQLTKNRKKYLMKFWYKKALLFSSVRYFACIFNTLVKREVLSSIKNFIEIQKVTLAYLDVFREESRAKSTFNAWKKVLRKKKNLAKKVKKFKLVEEKYSKLKPFKIWNNQYEKNKQKLKKLEKILNNIFVFSSRGKFLQWKKVITREKKCRESFLHRGKYLKNLVFRCLAQLAQEAKENMQKASDFNKSRDLKICQSFLSAWKRKGILRQILKNKKIKDTGKYFKSFVQAVQRLKYRIQKTEYLLENKAKNKVKQAFYGLFEYMTKSNKVKEFCQKLKKCADAQMLKQSFNFFKVYYKQKLEKHERLIKAQKHSSVKILKKYFSELFTNKNKFKHFLIQKNKSQSISLKRKYLNFLKSFSVHSKVSKNNYQAAVKHNNTHTKRSYFLKLLNFHTNFHQSKQSLQKNQSFNRLKSAFACLIKYTLSKKAKKSNIQKAKAHKISVLKKKSLKILSKARLKSQSIKNHKTQKLSSKLFEQSLKSLTNSSLSKTQRTNLAMASTQYYSNTLSKYFLLLLKHTTQSKKLKTSTSQGFSYLVDLISRNLKSSIFSDLQLIYIRDKKLLKRAESYLKTKILTRTLKSFRKFAECKKKMRYKQEIVVVKHAKILRKHMFGKWLHAMIVKNNAKKIMMRHKFLVAKKIFGSWYTELKIQEMQKNRMQKLKIFALAGLQIYSEKTVQAKIHINNFNVLETFNYMKQVFKSWNSYKTQKQLERFYTESYQQKLKKMALAGFKDYIYQLLIQREVFTRCNKNLVVRFVSKWKTALKKRIKTKKMLKKLLSIKSLRLKSISFGRMLHRDSQKQSNPELFTAKLYRKKINKSENLSKSDGFYKHALINKVFFAWDQYVSQHSIKRRRAFVHSIFFGWKIITRENSLLRKYLIESNLSERYLRSSVETGTGMLKSMSSLGSFHSIN